MKQFSSHSDEKRPETENQVVNAIERFNEEWKNRFTLDNPRLVENYVKGKLHFLILIEEAVKPRNQFVAFIERAIPKRFIGDDVEIERGTKVNIGGNVDPFFFQRGSRQRAPDKPGSLEVRHGRADGYQEAVLVDIVKLIESPENIVPSLVRFGRVDRIYCRLRHALYFSFTRGFVLRGTLRIDNGKTDSLAFCRSQGDSLSQGSDLHQIPSKIIKRASHVVEGISSNQRDNRRHGLGPSEIMLSDCLGKLRIWLDTNSVRIPVQEFSDFPFQILDVLVGPCGLYSHEPNSFINS